MQCGRSGDARTALPAHGACPALCRAGAPARARIYLTFPAHGSAPAPGDGGSVPVPACGRLPHGPTVTPSPLNVPKWQTSTDPPRPGAARGCSAPGSYRKPRFFCQKELREIRDRTKPIFSRTSLVSHRLVYREYAIAKRRH